MLLDKNADSAFFARIKYEVILWKSAETYI